MYAKVIIDDTNCWNFPQQKNIAAYQYLIRICFPQHCHFAKKIMVNDTHAAEDIVTDALLKMWQRAESRAQSFHETDIQKSFDQHGVESASIYISDVTVLVHSKQTLQIEPTTLQSARQY